MSEINKYNKVPDHIKILGKILSSKGELRLFVTKYVHFIRCKSICHIDYIWIISVDESDKLHPTASILFCLFVFLALQPSVVVFSQPSSGL
jgi:hypothetical protein